MTLSELASPNVRGSGIMVEYFILAPISSGEIALVNVPVVVVVVLLVSKLVFVLFRSFYLQLFSAFPKIPQFSFKNTK